MPAINKLILGTVQFGLEYGINNYSGKPGQETVNKILDLAFEKGIQLLDTAEAYGDAQEVIGVYHKQSNNRFNVITKFSSGRKDLPSSFIERVSRDLQVLNIQSLYCYMFHSFGDFRVHFEEHKDEIAQLKASGVIKKLGVSVYGNNEIDELLGEEDVDLIQLPFNLLDNNGQRSDSLKRAKNRGIEIHTRSAFLQGLFFKNIDDLPGKLKELNPHLKEIRRIADSNKLSLGDLSLNYVVQQSGIDNVLIGVDSPEQLMQNFESLENVIADQVVREIDLIHVQQTNLLNPSNWKN